jgi:outer membrane usher protein
MVGAEGVAESPDARRSAGRSVEVWLAIEINGVPTPTPGRFVRLEDGRLLVSTEALRKLRIRAPEMAPASIRGQDHVPLDAVAGIAIRVDESRQLLQIELPAAAFDTTVLARPASAFEAPAPTALGGFLNYDLQYLATHADRMADGWLEAGAFGAWGFGTSSFLASSRGPRRLLRLDTTWTFDDPARLRSGTLGDAISRPASWARAVRFGGVRWGTSFAIRPDVVAFPLPTLVGQAALPSSVDVYVDNALRFSGQTPSGPFEIPSAPLMTGQGQVRMVVRDLLGRETTFTQPFHVDAQLLKAGLSDETFEAGALRQRYGYESADYGSLFAAATQRRGLSDRLTLEWHAEALARQATAGAGAVLMIPGLGVINGAASASLGSDGAGGLLALGFRHDERRFSYGVQTRLASRDYVELADRATRTTPREETTAHVSYAPDAGGAAYLSFVRRRRPGDPVLSLMSVGYGVGIGPRMHLSAFALASISGARANALGVSLTWALDARTTVNADVNRNSGHTALALRAQRSLPAGSGIGYRLGVTADHRAGAEAALLGQTETGNYIAEAIRLNGDTSMRFGASGGVALLGGQLHASRRLDDSFALVRVSDHPGVPVLLDNQSVAHTDARGLALVTHLRPYQSNPISIGADVLPLDTELPASRIDVRPARRSGTVVDFAARRSRGALITITLDDGQALPAGAVVSVDDGAHEFPVARRGQVYVTGLTARSRIEARWKGQRCSIEVGLPAYAGPLPSLGPFACKGVRS